MKDRAQEDLDMYKFMAGQRRYQQGDTMRQVKIKLQERGYVE